MISSSPFKDIMKRNDTRWIYRWVIETMCVVVRQQQSIITDQHSADSALPVDSLNVMQVKKWHTASLNSVKYGQAPPVRT